MRLPEFVTEISPVRETLEAIGKGEEALAIDVEEAARQFYVPTAGRGLALWEGDYSLAAGETAEERRAAILTALAGGRTLTPEYLEDLCRTLGGGDWGQANEDFTNWTVTAYSVCRDRLPPGRAALDRAVERLKPAHLAVEAHPVGLFAPEAGRASALTGQLYGEASGDDGLRAGALHGAALTCGGLAELSGDDGVRAEARHGAALTGGVCRECSGGDALRSGGRLWAALTAGELVELSGRVSPS